MMWNYFITFFYEAALEIVLSVVLAAHYMQLYYTFDDPNYSNTSKDLFTRKFNEVMMYTFGVLQVLASFVILYIMTRSKETLERLLPMFGGLYENLKYTEDNWLIRIVPITFLLKRYCFLAMVFNF
jgi:hypothetical protein